MAGGGGQLLTRNMVRLPPFPTVRGAVSALDFPTHRKQGWLLGWPGRDLLQFRILCTQWLRHVYPRTAQHADQLQRVDHPFAKVVVVRDRKDFTRVFSLTLDALRPRSKFFGGIKIVVAFVRRNRRVVVEPGVITSPVQPDVSDRRLRILARQQRGARLTAERLQRSVCSQREGLAFPRQEGPTNDRLIDVAQRGVMLAQQREN